MDCVCQLFKYLHLRSAQASRAPIARAPRQGRASPASPGLPAACLPGAAALGLPAVRPSGTHTRSPCPRCLSHPCAHAHDTRPVQPHHQGAPNHRSSSSKTPACERLARRRVPLGYPKATPRVPKGYPKGTQKVPQGYPKGTPRVPKRYPKGTPRVPFGEIWRTLAVRLPIRAGRGQKALLLGRKGRRRNCKQTPPRCRSIYLSIHLCTYLSLSLSPYIYIYIYIHTHVSICLPIYLSI